MQSHHFGFKFHFPEGVGLNRRVLVLMALVFCGLGIFVLYSIHAVSVSREREHPSTVEMLNTDEAMNAIQAIQERANSPALVSAGSPKPDPQSHLPVDGVPHDPIKPQTFIMTPDTEEFKKASDAPISVYQSKTGSGALTSGAVKTGAETASESELTSLSQPKTPWTISAGSIIPVILVTGINSELPGTLSARVRENVYDSRTGNTLLIPQGASLIGAYDHQIAYGGTRVLVVWTRLIFPNGASLNLNKAAGSDLAGMSGLSDTVNNHTLRLFGMSFLYSLFSASSQLSHPEVMGAALSPEQQLQSGIGDQMAQTGSQLVAKNMEIPPTIHIRPGMNFTILLSHDIVLPGAYPFDVKHVF